VQVGSCGNKIGHAWWKEVATQHGIDFETGGYKGDKPEEQLGRVKAYFDEPKMMHFVPRAVLVDTQADVIGECRE
jgi:tubulin beta